MKSQTPGAGQAYLGCYADADGEWLDGGREYTIQSHFHLYSAHHAACRAAGLEIEDVREPIVERVGPWQGWPSVLVIRARKRDARAAQGEQPA